MDIKPKKLRELLYLTARNLTTLYFIALIIQISKLFSVEDYVSMRIFIIIIVCIDFIALFVNINFEKSRIIVKGINWIFQISVVTFLLILLAREFFYFEFPQLYYLMGWMVGLGMLNSFIPEQKTKKLVQKKISFAFVVFVSIAGASLVFIKTRAMGWLA